MSDNELSLSRPSLGRGGDKRGYRCYSIRSGWITTGSRAKRFEEELRGFYKVPL